MIWTKRIKNELYVYHNGSLIYKRWIKEGYGMVMDIVPFVPSNKERK